MTNQEYKILEMHQTSKPGEKPKGFALAKAISEKTPCQWVTWRYIGRDNTETPFFLSGNYWNKEEDARADLHLRISESYAQHAIKFSF